MEVNLTLVLFIIQICILAVSSLFLLISISNLWGLERLGKFPAPKRAPFVSILVPARNEEKNIKSCVESLLVQDYPHFEVLVLDDHSEDETEKILKSIKNQKLKFWKGKPLPEDWIGKPWACYQLAEKAKGELLLFTDADTVHEPGALKAAVAAMEAEGADFVTALPQEAAYSWSEALVIPIIPWSLHTFMP
ncbi:MAG: glycosyltransferase, partial [Nanoarchaeota archaeon]